MPPARRTRTCAAVLATGAFTGLAAAASPPVTRAPAGVVCAGAAPQYGYGPANPTPAYGIGTGTVTRTGGGRPMTLTARQMLINQRISQAAIRRTQAIQEWLDSGVQARDVCGGALGPEDFAGLTTTTDTPAVARPAAVPRPLKIGAVGGGDPAQVTLSREQMLVNQRISQAAVRRVNALRVRLVRGLTGGDVADGTLTAGTLRAGVRITGVTAVTPPAASLTRVAVAVTGNPDGVTVSVPQLRINQRISQAAVRRSNAIIAHLRTGLNGLDFRDGSLTPVDLARGVAPG